MGLDLQGSFTPNWPKMIARKDAIVSGFTKGVTGLLQVNKIAVFNGTGTVSAPGKVTVSGPAPAELEANRLFSPPAQNP
jgi:dihydrolipoamide dehydrogenase